MVPDMLYLGCFSAFRFVISLIEQFEAEVQLELTDFHL